MPARLKVLTDHEVAAAHAAMPDKEAVKTLVKHYLAVLETNAPGRAVEVRIPPYAAIQCIDGVRHTRGTPPAVIETDAATWIALATGEISWAQAQAGGTVRASGERTDLAPYLPLTTGAPAD